MTAKEFEGPELRQWLRRIEGMHPSDIELGLERVTAVQERLGLKRIATVQILVAGTNGKGSTVAMIEQVAVAGGLRVGSYTSPHITHYNERVKVQGVPLDDDRLVAAFEVVEAHRGDVPLTYFEFATLAAMQALAELDLDLCVLEVGLGGRLDAVNILDADLALVTSIGLDHTDWLGSNIELIAREKAGIMRSGSPVLLGETCPRSMHDFAHSLGVSRCAQIPDQFGFGELGFYSAELETEISSDALNTLDLPKNNVALAFEALVWLTKRLPDVFSPSPAHLCEWLAGVRVAGRLQNLGVEGVRVVLDVGHNPQAAAFLSSYLAKTRQAGQSVVAIFSALADKDVANVVSQLKDQVDDWYLLPLDAPRAMSRSQLIETLETLSQPMVWCASMDEALELALEKARQQGAMVLVFGSFLVVEQAHRVLISNE